MDKFVHISANSQVQCLLMSTCICSRLHFFYLSVVLINGTAGNTNRTALKHLTDYNDA
jgi:hypothetical protein